MRPFLGAASGLLQEGSFDCKAAAANAVSELMSANDRRCLLANSML